MRNGRRVTQTIRSSALTLTVVVLLVMVVELQVAAVVALQVAAVVVEVAEPLVEVTVVAGPQVEVSEPQVVAHGQPIHPLQRNSVVARTSAVASRVETMAQLMVVAREPLLEVESVTSELVVVEVPVV
jgi:hypothetical protein